MVISKIDFHHLQFEVGCDFTEILIGMFTRVKPFKKWIAAVQQNLLAIGNIPSSSNIQVGLNQNACLSVKTNLNKNKSP